VNGCLLPYFSSSTYSDHFRLCDDFSSLTEHPCLKKKENWL